MVQSNDIAWKLYPAFQYWQRARSRISEGYLEAHLGDFYDNSESSATVMPRSMYNASLANARAVTVQVPA